MKVSKLKETANILLDLSAVCKTHCIEDISFEVYDKKIEIYGSNEFVLILDHNFIGTIKNYEVHGYDAGQKFVIEL